jgi:hypothetical protein
VFGLWLQLPFEKLVIKLLVCRRKNRLLANTFFPTGGKDFGVK